MRTLRIAVWSVMSLVLACWLSPELRAGNPTDQPSPAANDLVRRLDELEKEIARLQAELALARKQLSEAASAASAPSAVSREAAPSSTPAAAASTATTAAEAEGSALAAKPAPSEAASSPSLVQSLFGSTNVSGFLDGYFGYNFNQPHSRTSNFRAFDGPSNQFSLNMIQLILDKTPDPNNSRLG